MGFTQLTLETDEEQHEKRSRTHLPFCSIVEVS